MPAVFGREFWAYIFWGGPEILEKQGRRIARENSLRCSPAIKENQPKFALQNLGINMWDPFLTEKSPDKVYVFFCRRSSEVSKGVGGERGLARGKPPYARDSGLFSAPFLSALLPSDTKLLRK